ncbi:UDP-glucuronate:xylan alpha-glucuronosyltransferase 2 isoform X2 [Cryptomeria japonica]|uniref:UDP-glucuronate:xylan alpha-glucuronosyltransferase 2 isoform X2 n=1 Tax=Cryptomeria japonica TaxID=3369 RepID=UPI0027DA948D|nr:UDP-glucuronate:xylan alpha-glucuronosyltransferase 2 isoform X2 [Cryptomeria japonica]
MSSEIQHNMITGRWRDSEKVEAIWERSLREERNPHDINVIDWRKLSSMITSVMETNQSMKIALVNIQEEEAYQWETLGETKVIKFDLIDSEEVQWTDLFPEWIDEEEQYTAPACPNVPMPEIEDETKFDLVVTRVPCRKPEKGWSRDVVRLQIQLVAARVAAKLSRNGKSMAMLFLTSCRPMLDLFRCEDLVKQQDDVWLYTSQVKKLAHKISLPVGSCELAVPLKDQGKMVQMANAKANRSEAYATILHSSETYVCGAIVLAQSIRMSGSSKDLIILVDKRVREEKRKGLRAAGWQVREIRRIRNPMAEKESYNEWNYSKFRLWQLTEYDKIIFIDSDLLILRNLDFLFDLPQISATGNSRFVFNSGMMVIEPSNCTFRYLMDHRKDIISYNGGDQGYLNEVFTWWHRLPRRINYLKHFWSNDTEEYEMKTSLFGADPPELYVLHFLGVKPWLCYRDYDCNWNVENQRSYASNVAHARWWKVHDNMPTQLHKFCLVPALQKEILEWDRLQAQIAGFTDQHWKRNITDPRLYM